MKQRTWAAAGPLITMATTALACWRQRAVAGLCRRACRTSRRTLDQRREGDARLRCCCTRLPAPPADPSNAVASAPGGHRAGQAPLLGHPAVEERPGVVRHLPRAGARLPGRPARGPGRGHGRTAHDADRGRGPQPVAVLGRAQGQPVVAGAGPAGGRRRARRESRAAGAPAAKRTTGRSTKPCSAASRPAGRAGERRVRSAAPEERQAWERMPTGSARPSTACSRTWARRSPRTSAR